MKEIKNTDVLFGDVFYIIVPNDDGTDNKKGVVITKYVCQEYDENMTFNDVLSVAKENGFSEGTFIVIAESPREGIIYQYANCYEGEPYWSEYGTTQGYA